MKTTFYIIGFVAIIFMTACETTHIYLPPDQPKPKITYSSTPRKVVGESNTYSSDSPESFRAVGPSN